MFTSRSFVKSVKILKWRPYSTNFSYIHELGKKPLQYITTGRLLEEANKKFSEEIAIISKHQQKSLTFSEVLTQVDKLAAGFQLIRLQKQDRVGIWAPNLVEWYITKLACARSGLIAVCLNPFCQPLEVEYCIRKAGMKVIVCADHLRDYDYYENLIKIVPELESSEPGRLKSTKVPSLQTVITLSDEKKRGTYNYGDILDLASSTDISNIQKLQSSLKPDDPSVILFTSGTTGHPKAALLTHFANINKAHLLGNRAEFYQKHHTVCLQLPFFHVFGTGSLIAGLCYGYTIVLPSLAYSPEKSFDAIKDERCTAIFGVPTMYMDLMEIQQKRKENISADMAVIGGAFGAPEFVRKVAKVLNIKKIFASYGMTETCGGVFLSKMNEDEEKAFTTVGAVLEHVEVKVIDGNDDIVPFGTAGELCVRSFCNMIKYWDDEEETRKALGEDGWLRTGDRFILEEDGYGKVVGRIKEMIIRGGENITPTEIEQHLLTHPEIVEAYVIGSPHDRLGEEVCACVRLKPNSKITHRDIVDYCKEDLTYFKIPSRTEIMDEFPRTASGKIQKFKLMEIVSSK